jgi:UDP-N-acetylglucosamine acyltransferase
MTNIHPTAIIHPDAKLDDSVVVGPYSIIDHDVEIGANCVISSQARIYQGTRMGSDNRVDHGAVIGCEPQDLSFDASVPTKLIIGNHNIFREHANVSRGSQTDKSTVIGDHNYLMATFHVGHDCIIGDHNILTHGTVLAGHILVGHHVFVSGVAAIHQFCQVGDHSMTAGCSKVVKDIPPYAVVDGNPATVIGVNSIGLKRAGFDAATRKKIKNAYQTLYKKKMNLSQALKTLEQEVDCPEVANILAFYHRSQRGITGHR